VAVRRTTLSADDEDLAVLEAEARRRGTSLARVLREVVAREADEVRARHRPRFGVGHSASGAAQAAGADEHAPVRDRRGR